jgi:hypothetical protein
MESTQRTEREERAAADSAERAKSEQVLRRRQVVGIVLITAAILAFALWRADWRGIFPAGWWRW